MRPTYCPDATPTLYGLMDFSIAPTLLYYSYVPILFVVLLMSLFVLRSDRNSLQSKLFAAISLSFTGWVIATILQWIAAPVTLVMFAWQILIPFEVATFIFATYFLYVFLFREDISRWFKILFAILFLPIILFMPTNLNIDGFDLYWCEGYVHELSFYYSYAVDLIMIVLSAVFAVIAFRKRNDLHRSNQSIIAASIGTVFFMSVFFITSFTGDIFFGYEVELIGPIGMVAFLALMVYLMVKFKIFGSKLVATEAFVGALVVLIGAVIFVESYPIARLMTSITLILAFVLGTLLVRSVRQEIKQRQELERLTVQLKKANSRLKVLDKMKSEFVSIASHQLRSPLTSIRGYASMLLEGSYGKIPDKAKQALERIADSSKHMIDSVEDYLNVSRIESGNMKYEMSDFNLRDETERVVDELRQVAMKKGLLLTFRSDLTRHGIVNADIGKTRQALHNLINNSIKYTERGAITVTIGENPKRNRIWIAISDTGIGMSQETIDGLFAKFSRAKDANRTNTSGTGLGLYVAKQMIEHMGGTICTESEGEGKGSTFTLELPLQQ